MGTVGCVVRDSKGDLAAATSTGGITNKTPGRIGDSPLIGAGTFADNRTCAVSATGYGEDFMRMVLARRIADIIDLLELDGPAAVSRGIEDFSRQIKGRGGVICVDHTGQCTAGMTTKGMIHGWIERGGASQTAIDNSGL
jgi:beta-aspartyl-peptidase (threonine type)